MFRAKDLHLSPRGRTHITCFKSRSASLLRLFAFLKQGRRKDYAKFRSLLRKNTALRHARNECY